MTETTLSSSSNLDKNDLLIKNKWIYKMQLAFLYYFDIFTKIILLLFLIGFFTVQPAIFISLLFFVKIIIAFFLLYRFNNYRKQYIVFTELDRRVCYLAGVYILIMSFADIILHYQLEIQKKIKPLTNIINNNIRFSFTTPSQTIMD